MGYLVKTVKFSAALCAALYMVTVSSAAAAKVNVSDLAWTQISNGWGPVEKDKSVNGNVGGDGRTLTLNNVTYAKGLGAHANSEIMVPLNGGYATFTADIGIDDEVGNAGSVIFIVKLDGKEMYRSLALTGASATVTILPITVIGGNDLRLIVDMNGVNTSDHADWCNPVLTTQSTSAGIHNQVMTLNANNTPTWEDDYIIRDIDGNEYHTITFGTQKWTVENLKTTRFRDGTTIPQVINNWSNPAPGFCYYNNDAANKNIYGALYNWYAVNTGKLAPAGWHVPTDAEWTTLQNYLIASGNNWDGTTSGNKIAKSMAAQRLWETTTFPSPGCIGIDLIRNNTSGFSALPGGFRDENGDFFNQRLNGHWWSATGTISSGARYCYLYNSSYNLGGANFPASGGFSVRLVRD